MQQPSRTSRMLNENIQDIKINSRNNVVIQSHDF